MPSDLHWTEYLKAVGPTLIAVFIAYVAYQQWQVNRANLREKLFDKRFAVFEQTQMLLTSVVREANASNDAIEKFHSAPKLGRFLFGNDIHEYLVDILRRAHKLQMYHSQLEERPVCDDPISVAKQHSDELRFLIKQFEVFPEKFEPYLGFEKHK